MIIVPNQPAIYNNLILNIINYDYHLIWWRWSYKGDVCHSELCNRWLPMFYLYTKDKKEILQSTNNVIKISIKILTNIVAVHLQQNFFGLFDI